MSRSSLFFCFYSSGLRSVCGIVYGFGLAVCFSFGIKNRRRRAFAQEISKQTICNTLPFSQYMLPDDDPRVVSAFRKLQSTADSEDNLKESLSNGKSWPKCFAKHQMARTQLAERFHQEALGHMVCVCVSVCVMHHCSVVGAEMRLKFTQVTKSYIHTVSHV